MIGKTLTLLAASGAVALVAAPAAQASGGQGGGQGGGQAASSNCQIKQLSNTPVLTLTGAAITSTYALTGCAGDSWTLTYLNTALNTTDYTASGTTDPNGASQGTVEATPLPYNYPYRITLTVSTPAGTGVATRASTLFTPKPKD
ncbi:hypothetical protein [uncultured Jatrophihabitans sp.]|uniref:hypothetical protein n=1 Tax=uncultured Jatrophihabitans sp. TaxID=1610747 RepID=UPI0035C9A510